ncbi:MAG: hypothetical protein LW698_13540 [Planctomycetaceae bacterium]|nr:hypothetical protein [Planctomycetaceae bacterium]
MISVSSRGLVSAVGNSAGMRSAPFSGRGSAASAAITWLRTRKPRPGLHAQRVLAVTPAPSSSHEPTSQSSSSSGRTGAESGTGAAASRTCSSTHCPFCLTTTAENRLLAGVPSANEISDTPSTIATSSRIGRIEWTSMSMVAASSAANSAANTSRTSRRPAAVTAPESRSRFSPCSLQWAASAVASCRLKARR